MRKNESPSTTRILTKYAWLPTIVEDMKDGKDYIIWFKEFKSYEKYLPVNSIHLSIQYVFTHQWVVIKKFI